MQLTPREEGAALEGVTLTYLEFREATFAAIVPCLGSSQVSKVICKGDEYLSLRLLPGKLCVFPAGTIDKTGSAEFLARKND